MKNAVILYHQEDADIALRLNDALALMKRQGIIKITGSLDIQPGQDIIKTLQAAEACADVILAVISVDFNLDKLYALIEEHEKHQTCLLVVYSNHVDEALISELSQKGIPIFPSKVKPIKEELNPDKAMSIIAKSIRAHFNKKDVVNKSSPKKNSRRKNLLFLIGARSNLQKDE